MTVTHTTQTAAADDPAYDVSADEWNEAHSVGDGSFVAAKLSATATDKVFGRSTAGAGNGEEIALTAAGRALIDDATAADQRTTLGVPAIAHSHADLSATGEFALSGDISPAQLTANTDNWAPTGLAGAAVIRFSTDALRTLTGLTGGADGRIIALVNIGSFGLVLAHDVTSTAANRFFLPGAFDDIIWPGTAVELWYDSTSSRWRTISRGVNPLTKALSADQSDITGTSLVELTGLTIANVGVGIYQFKYAIIWQATALTTGVELVVDHTGTDTEFVSTAWTQTTGAAAATGIADQVTTATAQLLEGKSARVAGARTGVLQGVDTINAHQLTIIEGVIVVSVTGSLQVFMAAELASLVVRAKRGSSVVLHRVG